ncbi:ubiquitin carboxyl-terminal hydrolase [Arthroderma uncinatum]|uniref:ubiquitin carboxyl-terminal hydrolase n=1 Tax=Arthroderma uncinatum TaxID=74035 RepID=UPI00144AD347|nr:ubiquitin carboxyl-terminal hydrolase [Arthroderma uncinatum]KAF3483563.1 ubiquitin carboxyl-terminal hydrolase [Arthroderma uncinatum]
MFQSVLKYRSTCQNCQHTKYSEKDHSWVLSAPPLEGKLGSIEDCIREYMKPEIIPGYKCDNCKTESTLYRQMFIRDAPEVLVVQITRFKVSETGESSRLTTRVTFAEDLDLTPRLIPRAGRSGETLSYQLSSVVVHRGTTIKEGHYISYVKGPNGAWASLDDEFSEHVDISAVLNCHEDMVVPYVLIYNRKPLFTATRGGQNTVASDTGTHSIIEIGFSPPGEVEEISSSTIPGVSAHITPDLPQEQQNGESAPAAPEASDGLSDLFDGSQRSSAGPPDPSLGARWEGQPAEIAVQVIMGDIVLTGVLKGILQRSKRLGLGSVQGGGAKPTGIVKSSRSPLRAHHGR